METNKFEVRQILKSKKFWFTSFLIAWAAALQVLVRHTYMKNELFVFCSDFLGSRENSGPYYVATEARFLQEEVRGP